MAEYMLAYSVHTQTYPSNVHIDKQNWIDFYLGIKRKWDEKKSSNPIYQKSNQENNLSIVSVYILYTKCIIEIMRITLLIMLLNNQNYICCECVLHIYHYLWLHKAAQSNFLYCSVFLCINIIVWGKAQTDRLLQQCIAIKPQPKQTNCVNAHQNTHKLNTLYSMS